MMGGLAGFVGPRPSVAVVACSTFVIYLYVSASLLPLILRAHDDDDSPSDHRIGGFLPLPSGVHTFPSALRLLAFLAAIYAAGAALLAATGLRAVILSPAPRASPYSLSSASSHPWRLTASQSAAHLRMFARFALADALLFGLVLIPALLAAMAEPHAICEAITRGESPVGSGHPRGGSGGRGRQHRGGDLGSGGGPSHSALDFARSVEACEDRAPGLAMTLLAMASMFTILRLHAAAVVWRYADTFRDDWAPSSPSSGYGWQRLPTATTSSACLLEDIAEVDEPDSDVERGIGGGRGKSGPSLLPSPFKLANGGGAPFYASGTTSVRRSTLPSRHTHPYIATEPSSPISTSPHRDRDRRRSSSSSNGSSDQRVLVYAPVLMTPEDAERFAASASSPTHQRSRSRSARANSAPSSTSPRVSLDGQRPPAYSANPPRWLEGRPID